MQLDCNFKWLIDEIVEGVRETLLPNGDATLLRFLDGVLLNEKARPTFIRVRVASRKALDNVPRLTSWISIPISWDWTLTTNFSCNKRII